MHTKVFWIERLGAGLVGVMSRPRGGDWLNEELLALAQARVEVLVSLLTAEEVAELELQEEERLCGNCGIHFVSFPISDRGVPLSIPDTGRIVDLMLAELRAGKTLAIHCRMGIGRSALVAACLLVSEGIEVDEAFARISRARGFAVPDTDAQAVWVKAFATFRSKRYDEGPP